MLVAIIIGVASFRPNVEGLSIFEKDKVTHEKINDIEDDKDVVNRKN